MAMGRNLTTRKLLTVEELIIDITLGHAGKIQVIRHKFFWAICGGNDQRKIDPVLSLGKNTFTLSYMRPISLEKNLPHSLLKKKIFSFGRNYCILSPG